MTSGLSLRGNQTAPILLTAQIINVKAAPTSICPIKRYIKESLMKVLIQAAAIPSMQQI